MLKLVICILLMILCGFSPLARADSVFTLNQQIWVPFPPNIGGHSVHQSGVLEFSKFNPALGTLLDARIEVGYGIYMVYRLTNPTANALSFGGYMDAHLSIPGHSRWFGGIEGRGYLAGGAQIIAYPSVHFPVKFDVMGIMDYRVWGRSQYLTAYPRLQASAFKIPVLKSTYTH